MTRHRKTNLGVFVQYQHTRTILRNKNMGQSLFKKHSKFLNFDVTWPHSGTRFWVIVVCVDTWKLLNQRKFLDSLFKSHLKFQNFNIQYSFLLWYGQWQAQAIGRFLKIYLHNSYCKKENYETKKLQKMT